MKYELAEHFESDHAKWYHALLKCITGLEYDELDAAIKANKNNGQGTIQTFRDLGFNVSPRWEKFDPQSQLPAMLRCRDKDAKNCWYPFIYYDGKVYAPHHYLGGELLQNFLDSHDASFKITSMINVWI